MSTLRLLVQLLAVFETLGADLAARSKQLAVAQNRRQWVVKFMRHTRDQLADRSQLFAMQELLLRAAEVVISLARLIVEKRPFDGAGDLAAGGNQQVNVSGRKFPGRSAANDEAAYNFVLRPQDHDVRSDNLFGALHFPEDRGERQALDRQEGGVHGFDVLQQLRLHPGRGEAACELRAMAKRGDAPQHFVGGVKEVKRGSLQPEQFADLPQRFVQRIAQVQRFVQRGGNGIQ